MTEKQGGKKRGLTGDEITTEPVGRRSAIRTLGLGLGVAAVAMTTEACHHRGIRGCTDSDPYDRAGYGRRCGGYYGPGYRCSDRDPYDPAGSGRHC
jgi:hypothetical protein